MHHTWALGRHRCSPREPSQPTSSLSSFTSDIAAHLLLVQSKGQPAREEGLLPLGQCSSWGLSALFPTIIAISAVTCIISTHSADKISSTLCMARYVQVLNAGMNVCYYLFNSRRAQEPRCWVAEWEIESHSSAWTTILVFLNPYPLNLVLVRKDILIYWEQNNFLSLQGLILNSSLTWLISFQ